MAFDVMGPILVALMGTAVWFDLRERRIPNALTVGGLLLGLAMRVPGGWEPVGTGLLGAAIAFAVGLPFFLVGGLGGGDVKLLAAGGAFLGLERLFIGLVTMAFVGGALAIVEILRKGAVSQVAANLRTIFTTFGSRTFTGWKGEESEAALTLETPGAVSVPYGIAIAAGFVAGWYL